VVSLSAKTVIYKGLLKGQQLPRFYPDLGDPLFASAIALVHERFSTNTLGSWQLAHPYRYIAHNGEINTIKGNVNWMRARESRLRSELFGDDLGKLSPVIVPGQSDSAGFRQRPRALAPRRAEPPARGLHDDARGLGERRPDGRGRRDFYRYHSALMEPWDGPAAVAFTDGRSSARPWTATACARPATPSRRTAGSSWPPRTGL
jgi:glutamate synthase domain-containing protein 1